MCDNGGTISNENDIEIYQCITYCNSGGGGTGAQGATGATGPAGSGTSNVTNSPPSVIFGPTTSTATSAYISWTYPPQTPAGFMPYYIPYIVSFSANLVTTTSGSVTLINSDTSTNYINNNGVGSVTAIILTNDSTYISNPIQTVTFPSPLSGTFISKYIYISTLQTILADGSGQLNAWYANYNPTYNSNVISINPLTGAGAPTAPQNLALIYETPNNTLVQTFTLDWDAPLYSDSINNTNTIPIKNYDVQYSTIGTTIGRIQTPQSLQTVDSGTNTQQSLTVYPDCVYVTNVYAYNTANVQPGDVSTNLNVTSNAIPRVASATLSPTFTMTPTPNLTGYKVSDSTASTLISGIKTNTTTLSNSSISFAISCLETRGTLGYSNLISINSNIVNGTSEFIGPNVFANNISIVNSSTLNGLTITSTTLSDSYISSFVYNRGFYYRGTLAVTNSSFTASPNVNTLYLTQKYVTVPLPVGVSNSISTFSYYYDSIVGVPSSSNYNFLLTGGSFRQISGIWVLYAGTPQFEINGSSQNVGNFFYKQPILSYSISSTSQLLLNTTGTTGTSQVSPSSIVNGNQFTATVDFSIPGVNTSTPTLFANNILLDITARNINGTGSTFSTSNSIIVDVQSDLSNRVENASILSTSVLGSYDETLDLTGTDDLQCVNGSVCTKTSFSYLDYTPYWYYSGTAQQNILDYSGITSGTRYVTVQQQYVPRLNPYTNINIVLTGSGFSSITTGFTSIYYRSIDITQSTPSGSGNISSYWVNGFPGATGTQLTGSNFYNPSLSLFGIIYDLVYTGSTQISGTLYFPGGVSITGNPNYYFYLQLGLDVSVTNITISSIQVIMS
jgi:hypothetical protein